MERAGLSQAKAALRQRMTALRDALPEGARAAASRCIAERLMGLPEWAAARTLFVYVSFRSEVSTQEILEAALSSGRRLLAPRVRYADHEMDACEVRSLADLRPGRWGILEPDGPAANPTAVDLVVAPGLAFDVSGARLGYGAGYYDRFLRATRLDCARVGLAFAAQYLPAIPCGPDDERLHIIVTEHGAHRVRPTGG